MEGKPGRCPSCKSYLNEEEECDVCGWTPLDGVKEAPEERDAAPEEVVEEERAEENPVREQAVEELVKEERVEEKLVREQEEEGAEDAEDDVPVSADGKAPEGRCPSCKSYLNEDGGCEVCGWMPGDEEEEDGRESGIATLMDLHGISRAKAERLYDSRMLEKEEEREEEKEEEEKAASETKAAHKDTPVVADVPEPPKKVRAPSRVVVIGGEKEEEEEEDAGGREEKGEEEETVEEEVGGVEDDDLIVAEENHSEPVVAERVEEKPKKTKRIKKAKNAPLPEVWRRAKRPAKSIWTLATPLLAGAVYAVVLLYSISDRIGPGLGGLCVLASAGLMVLALNISWRAEEVSI